MVKILYIGFGGFLGSVSRYAVSGFFYRLLDKPWFPYGTMAVNLIGCLVIGFLGGISEFKQVFSPELRLLVFIGFLGGFTTFSTFEFEVFQLLRDNQFLPALINVAVQIITGLGAVWVGFLLAKLI